MRNAYNNFIQASANMYGSLFGTSESNRKTNEDGTFHDEHGSSSAYQLNDEETQISLPPVQQQSSLSHRSSDGLLSTGSQSNGGGGNATFLSCCVNLANTIVGAGMLGLPGAFGGSGYIGGSILIFLGALFSAHGLQLLSKAAQQTGLPSSFYSVAHAAVPQYTILIDLAVALKCFGVATGYLITIGDCMVDALDHILLNGDEDHDNSILIQTILSRQFWVLGAVVAVLPVSFYRTLDELKKASALALVFVFFLAFGIIAYANGLADPCLGESAEECRGEVERFTDVPRTLSKLPIFVFAFTCHQNIFPVVNEIQKRTQERLNMVVLCSIGFAFVIFFTVALAGYQTFGVNVRGDILLSYPETGKVTVLRICIAFMLALHYPLQLDPSRRCITSLIGVVNQWRQGGDDYHRAFHRHDSGMDSSSETPQGGPTERSMIHTSEPIIIKASQPAKPAPAPTNTTEGDPQLFYIITISFLLLSFLVAMVVDDLGIVLAMVGATGSTLVSYILPGLIYLKIYPVMDASRVGAYIQLTLGCIIMPVALYFVLSGGLSH